MSESIHGHQVMQMMIDSQEPFTKVSLKEKMLALYGADARYHTCSQKEMDADQLITLLEARGKFVGSDQAFTTDPSRMCNHDHEH